MANQNIARLGVVLGLDMAEFSAGIEKSIQSTKHLNAAIARESQSAAKEILALEYAVRDYGRQVSKVELIQREFIVGGKYASAKKGLQDLLVEKAKAYDALALSATNADKAMGKSAGMDRYLKSALAYQTTDIVTSLAGGQNPLMVLLQQGGQLRDQFGGFKPLFAGIAEAVTLSKVAFTGAGAAVGALAFAFYKGSVESAKFRDDLILTNNYAGITAGNFDKLSASISDKLNISIGDTREIFNALVSSGTVTKGNLEVFATTIAKVSQLSGEAADTVAQRLLPSFDGTASSAAKLNNTFHFLNIEQYKQIEALDRAGKKQEAAHLTAELLNKTLQGQARDLGYLETAWKGVTNGLSSFWDKLKSIGRDTTTEDALARIDEKIKSLQGPNSFGESQTARKMRLDAAINERQELQTRLEAENEKARQKEKLAKDKANIELYSGAGGAAKALEIESSMRKLLIDKAYEDSLFNANEMERVSIESAKRIAEKTLEIEKQNVEEKFVFSSMRYKELGNFVLSEESKAAQQKQKISRDTYLSYEKKQISEKDSLDMEKQRMGIYQSNIFLTETEAKLAERRLETQQRIAEIVRDMNNGKMGADAASALIKEQEAIGKTKDEIIGLGEKLQYIKDVNQAVFQSMTMAIQAFLITGKFNFKNFALSVVASLMQIQAQMMAMAAMRGMSSIFGMMSMGMGPAGGTATGT